MRFFSCSFHDSSAALSPKNAGRLATKAGPRAWLGHLATSNNSDAVRQSFPYLMPKATTNDLHDDARYILSIITWRRPISRLSQLLPWYNRKNAKEKITQQWGPPGHGDFNYSHKSIINHHPQTRSFLPLANVAPTRPSVTREGKMSKNWTKSWDEQVLGTLKSQSHTTARKIVTNTRKLN